MRLFPCNTAAVVLVISMTFLLHGQDAPAQAGKDGAGFTVKLTKLAEISDWRGRLLADGKRLIVERWDSTGQMKVLDARTGKELKALDARPRSFTLSPDGRTLAALTTAYLAPPIPPKREGVYHLEMKVWDLTNPLATKERMAIPEGHSCVFSPDGRWLLAHCQDQLGQKVRWELWGLDAGKRLASFPLKQPPGEYCPAFSPDGKILAFPTPEDVKLYEVPSGKELRVLAHKSGRPIYENHCVLFARGDSTRTMFAPDSKTLATGGDDGKVTLWDVASGKVRATLEGHGQPHTFVRYSPDGKRLLTGSVGTVEVLRVAPGLPGRPPVTGKARIIDRTAGEVILWDAQTLAKQHTLPIHCPPSLSWSADGTILAAGDQSKSAAGKPTSLQLWDTARGRLLGTWESLDDAQFAADGKTLLTWNVGRLVVWAVERIEGK
jgi:WD40 repeat protein